MATIREVDRTPHLPTPESPDYGTITFGGERISHVAHWVEDGDHVLRSTEFDLIAGDPDFDVAVLKFVENAEDLAGYLADLTRAEDATDDEAETATILLRRLGTGYRMIAERLEDEFQRHSRRLFEFPRLRHRRGEHATPRAAWHQSRQTTSPPPVSA